MSIWLPAIEQGLLYGLLALGVYLTFRVLNFADLTVDGSFPLGASLGASLIVGGHSPVFALVVATFGGFCAGTITGLLSTKGRITPLLSGILTMTALYSINLRIMGRPNIPLIGQSSVFRILQTAGVPRQYTGLLIFSGVAILAVACLYWFLTTELGLTLRATGNNPKMTQALGVNTDLVQILGLGLANSFVALSGALASQYQGFADVNLGVGMVISGLASVIVGEAIIKGRLIWQIGAVLLGSLIYRAAVYSALRLGFPATDLKLVTATLVVMALILPQIRGSKPVMRSPKRKSASLRLKQKAGETEHA